MKKFVSILLMTLLCTTMTAQRGAHQGRGGHGTQRASSQKNTIFYIGPKIGADFTSMTQPKECNLADGMGMGFSGGAAVKARFGKASGYSPAGTGLLGIGLEAKYKLNSAKTTGTSEDGKENANLSVGYLEVPVCLQLHPFYRSEAMNSFYIEMGPSFASLLNSSPKWLTANDAKGEYSSVAYKTGDLKGFDVRFMAGVGVDLPVVRNSKQEASHLLGINARYYMGTSSLAGNFDSKMNTIELSVSWMFSLGKL